MGIRFWEEVAYPRAYRPNMALNLVFFIRKKCLNVHWNFYAFYALKFTRSKWWNFQCTCFLFKMTDTSTFIFILRGLLNRYGFQTFSKLCIYISNIGKKFFCKKKVWNKARIKIQKIFIKILPYLLYHSRVYTCCRTPDGAKKVTNSTKSSNVYTRAAAHGMERVFKG